MEYPKHYQVKPYLGVVKAIRFAEDGSNWQQCLKFANRLSWPDDGFKPLQLDIMLVDRVLECNRGDWIVESRAGIMVYSNEFFEKTYEYIRNVSSYEEIEAYIRRRFEKLE
jgi:hypothetical protein